MTEKQFSVSYKVGDNTVIFELGQEVYYIETEYKDEYVYCKECKNLHSIGKKYSYRIISATICGFDIRANHCFSYNIRNQFVLKINIVDEDDRNEIFDVGNVYFKVEDAQKAINERVSNTI